MNRRTWLGSQLGAPLGLALTQVAWLGGCAAIANDADLPGRSGDHIRDTATGKRLSRAGLLDRMLKADLVLLGEIHDNPHHHQRRAELLASLGRPVAVVVEHLPRGAAVGLPSDARGDALRQILEQAGFDARGWQWPLHAPVFASIARAGQPLHGGNLPRETVRAIARSGTAAMPTAIKAIIDAAPLPATAQLALEQELQAGHCGQLAASHLPGMVAAQRSRDAAMAAALAEVLDDSLSKRGPGPVVLLAGNGHVRRDHGVPQLLASRLPRLQMLAVRFAEAPAIESAMPNVPFDIVWTTPKAARADPCAGFTMPRATGS